MTLLADHIVLYPYRATGVPYQRLQNYMHCALFFESLTSGAYNATVCVVIATVKWCGDLMLHPCTMYGTRRLRCEY